MSVSIYFESYFRQRPYENIFKSENYQEWTVEEKWSGIPNVIQEITLTNEDEYFESYYYVDLEIVSAFQENGAKILKSERMASNNIKFLIKGNEFLCFQPYCETADVDSENYARDHTYRYKITLTPILQLYNETFPKAGKQTKTDILGGLKTLSNDIASMKGKLFSDIIIYCGNKKVKAHRNILSARSTLFKKFLQGVEDKEVKSCLKIEPVIVEKDCNSVEDSLDADDDDPSTVNDSDAAVIHTEEANRVQIIVNIESEINADEATDGDKGSTSIDSKEDEVQNCLEIKSKTNDDPTNDDKDCAILNSEKNKNMEVLNSLEIKPKVSDDATVDDSTNVSNDTTSICVKKDNEVQHYLGIKSEINDYFFEDDSCTNDNDDSTNENITLNVFAEKDNEVQNKVNSKHKNFDTESETTFNADASTSAVPVEEGEEIQYGIELESDHESDDGNDISAMSEVKSNEVQNNVEIQPEYASNNNEALPPTIQEDELQNESESGESDDGSSVSSDNNILKVRLKKIHSSIFHEFIDFIYSGQFKTSDIKKAKDLLIAARNYGICDLELKCIMYLRSQISTETSDDIYNFASVCKCEDLQMYVLDYLKSKIIGKKRTNSQIIQMIEQQGIDVEDEEGITTFEKIRWLKAMRNHPTYFNDIQELKKGKQIKEVILRLFSETGIDDDDVMEDCRECIENILNICIEGLGNG